MDGIKKKKQFRKKVVGVEDEDQPTAADTSVSKDNDNNNNNKKTTTPKATTPTPKKSGEPAKSGIKLSFEEEEEEGTFEVKKKTPTATKKKSSRKFMRDTSAAPSANAPLANVSQSSYGDYTPEMLERLKKNSVHMTNRSTPVLDTTSHKTEPTTQMDDEQPEEDSSAPATGVGGETVSILNAAQLEQLELQEDEEDEELRRWEMQQIRKGATAAGAGQQSVPTTAQLKKAVAKPTAASATRRDTVQQAILGGSTKVTVEEMQRRLKVTLAAVTDKHTLHSQQLKQAQTTIETARASLIELDKQYSTVTDAYMFYSELKDYVLDLCDCLAEKAAEVDDCEEKLMNLEIEHARNSEQVRFKAGTLWKDAPDASSSTVTTEYNEKKEDLLFRGARIFADTFEEFSSIQVIKNRFEAWKFTYPDTYDRTYCANVMPNLFAPFAKVELLKWNPFVDPSFDNMTWYTTLFNYGMGDSEQQQQQQRQPLSDNDEDLNLIPNLISKVVVPKAVKFLSHVWDIRDSAQGTAASELIKVLSIYLEPTSDPMKELLAAVTVTIRGGIESIPHSIHSKDDTSVYLHNAVELISNILKWGEYLSVDTSQKLIVESLMNTKLIPILNQTKSVPLTVQITEQIATLLPSTWFGGGSHEGKVPFPSRLALFHNYVTTSLLKKVEAEQTNNKSLLISVVRVLRKLNDTDTARKVITKHSLPDT